MEKGLFVSGWDMGCAEEGLWGKFGLIVLPLGWSSSTAQISEERLRVQPMQEDGLW